MPIFTPADRCPIPRSAHTCLPLLLMASNCSPSGGDAPLRSVSPQQRAVPFSRKPHVYVSPLLTAMSRSPLGGDDWPCSSKPQQTGVPSSRNAQVYKLPLLMAVNRSLAGGEAWPSSFLPQQIAVPSVRNAHVCKWPLLTAVKRGVGVESSVAVLGGVGIGVAVVFVSAVAVGSGVCVDPSFGNVTTAAPGWPSAHTVSSAAIAKNKPMPASRRQRPFKVICGCKTSNCKSFSHLHWKRANAVPHSTVLAIKLTNH